MAPPIPNEIYRHIMDQFHSENDIRTLKSIAQSSSLLRYESQRILFHTAFQNTWDTDKDNPRRQRAALRRHISFLEAVVNSPARLGPLVRSYTQWGVAYDGSDEPKDSTFLRGRVSYLTSEALRCMVNLKELRFASFQSSLMSMHHMLHRCTFQLESFAWTPWGGDDQENHFLYSQKALRHFDTTDCLARNLKQLSLSPMLESIKGCVEDLFMINRKTIVALDYWGDRRGKYSRHISATAAASGTIGSIRYLRVPTYLVYRALIDTHPPWPALSMMELNMINFEDALAVIMLPPTLRVLVIRFNDQRVQDQADAEGSSWILTQLFSTSPVLKYIDIHPKKDPSDAMSSWRYVRPANDANTISVEALYIDNLRVDGMWWRNHLVGLVDN